MKNVFKVLLVASLFLIHFNVSASEYAKATYKGKPDLKSIASLACLKNDFWDPRNGGECWSCNGKDRTIFPVNGSKACLQPVGEQLSKAKKHKEGITSCPKGSFLDPRNGGECWSCPSKTHRTLYGVTSSKACFKRIGQKKKKAHYKYNTHSIFKSCKRGTFANVGSTKCYTCPKGWRHNGGKKVNKNGVCYKPAYDQYHKATKKSSLSASCSKGQFYDLTNGGSCWSCPKGSHRTAFPVTHKNACSKPVGGSFAKAIFHKKSKVIALGCDTKWKGAFFDPRKGGECWSCGTTNPTRTLHPVDSKQACATNTCGKLNGRPCFVWEKFPSCDKGLMEDPITNKCVNPSQFACKALVGVLASVKKLNEEAKGKSEEAKEKALDAIPGARQAIRYSQNINNEMNKQTQKLLKKVDYSKVTKQLNNAVRKNRKDVEKVLKVAVQLSKKTKALSKIFLDADLICGGDGKKIANKIRTLGLDKILASNEPGILEFLNPIKNANAATGDESHMITIDFTVDLPKYRTPAGVSVAPSIGLQYATDFNKQHSLSFTQGIGFEKTGEEMFVAGYGWSVGWAYNNGTDPLPKEYPIGFGANLFGKLDVGFDTSGFGGLSVNIAGVDTDVETLIKSIFSDSKSYNVSFKPAMEASIGVGGGVTLWENK